jgi:hypothetical protein
MIEMSDPKSFLLLSDPAHGGKKRVVFPPKKFAAVWG